MSPTRIEKIRAHMEHLLDLFIGLRAKYALLAPLAFDASVVEQRGSGAAGQGLVIVRNALFYSCIHDLAKLTLDKDDRAPSVINLVEVVADRVVCARLRREYSAWVIPRNPDDDPEVESVLRRMEEKERRGREMQFDNHLAELCCSWEELRQADELQACQIVRDKLVAHSEVRFDPAGYKLLDLSSLGMKWGDLEALIERLQAIVDLLNLIIRGSNYGFGDLKVQLEEAADAFWRPPETD